MSFFDTDDSLWMPQEQLQVQDQEPFSTMLQHEIHTPQDPAPLSANFAPVSNRSASSASTQGGVVRHEHSRSNARAQLPYRRPGSAQPRQQAPHRRYSGHHSEPSPIVEHSPSLPDTIPALSRSTVPLQHTTISVPPRHPPYPTVNPAPSYQGQRSSANPGLSPTNPIQTVSHGPTPVATTSSTNINPFAIRKRRFKPRADSSYSIPTKQLIHVCELPGVKRSDLKVSLSVCIYNGIRVLEIEGVSRPFFPIIQGQEEDGVIRERHHGGFYRMFPVPFDTNEEDVVATLSDGILVLRIHCRSAPSSVEEVEASRRSLSVL